MKKEDSLYDLRNIINDKVFNSSQKNLHEIAKKCVKENRFTYTEFANIQSGAISIDTLSEQQLFWLLDYSNKIIKGLGKVEDYFTDSEILNNKFYETKEQKPVTLPITFTNVQCLTPDSSNKRQFCFCLSVENIKKYKANNILQVVPELQRGGKKDRYGELKTIINNTRRDEITRSIKEGKYFYNSIRISLIDDDEAEWHYDSEENTITVVKGTLITPDGNHRAVACEFIDDENAHSSDLFVVLFTFLTPSDTKKVMSQEWNTEPVDKRHRKSIQVNVANQIVESLKRSDEIDDLFKNNIVTTGIQIKNHDGFIVYSTLSDAISRHYNTRSIVKKEEQNEIVRWLIVFFNRLFYIYKKDFNNYKKIYKTKWNVKPYAFAGYILLSKYLEGKDNWKEELQDILNKIDFTRNEIINKNRAEKAQVKYIEDIFLEALDGK